MRLGIDIDDTITDTNEALIKEAFIYNDEIGKKLIDRDAYSFMEMFDWTYDEYLTFLKLAVDKVMPNLDVKPHVKEVIDHLKENNEIYFITARKMVDKPYETTKNWLDRHGIYYDKIIVQAISKGQVCKENGIDIFLDDNIANCLSVAQENIETLIFDTIYNRDDHYFKRIKDWLEFEKYVNDKNNF